MKKTRTREALALCAAAVIVTGSVGGCAQAEPGPEEQGTAVARIGKGGGAASEEACSGCKDYASNGSAFHPCPGVPEQAEALVACFCEACGDACHFCTDGTKDMPVDPCRECMGTSAAILCADLEAACSADTRTAPLPENDPVEPSP